MQRQRSLRILAWPDYTLDEVHRRFKAKTGVQVEFDHFDQNEEAFMRLSQHPSEYDLIFADGLWPVRYVEEGLVDPLAYRELHTWSQLAPAFQQLCSTGDWAVDGGSAAFPANFGFRGIIWDPARVDAPITSWKDLWRSDLAGRVWINSQGSEIVAETALSLGFPSQSVYGLEGADLGAVEARMVDLGGALGGIWMVWPELEAAFSRHGAAAAELHTTHLAPNLRLAHGVPYEVTVPSEGTIAWVDGAMLPRRSERREEAMAFIDYLFSVEGVGLQWEHSDGYAPTNSVAMAALKEDPRHTAKVVEIERHRADEVLNLTLYRPPADMGAYLGAWKSLLSATTGRVPPGTWGAIVAAAALAGTAGLGIRPTAKGAG